VSRGEGAAPAREVALRVLRRVDEGAYADRALAGEARKARLGPEDRALAMQLVFGVVQRRRTLDWIIDEAVDRPAALEAAVRDVLRLGAYQLVFLDGVPAPVVVDESVRQAKTLRGSSARRSARGGIVNATLRGIAASAAGERELLADPAAASPAVRHSMPDWIAERLVDAHGAEDAEGVMAAANRPAESAIRWNPLRGPRATLEAELPEARERDPLLPEAYVLHAPFALEDSAAWARGRAIGQSRASMIPGRALAPMAGERVLDLCAAPGAKSTHIAALARNACRLTAVELHASRARALGALARRMGARLDVVEGDAREVPLEGGADAVLLDPPCTGLGVLAARPDARWRRREEALAPLVDLQRGLVTRAMELLRPGGRLVYSTCTLLPDENEGVLASLGLRLDPSLAEEWPAFAHPRVPGALLVLPHRHGTDGFFVARVLA
jgi:16S rRNA (cytosine967-C5)-methyltransferase